MGRLILIATPIGNLEDMTYRAVRLLGEVDVLACEDTRQTRKLLDRYDVPRPQKILSYHEHNEERAGAKLLELLQEDKTVALCSDGGMPAISDPGYRLISAAIAEGHGIEALPGASAVQTALVLSGLPTSSYTFKGFPPRKPGARRRFLEEDAGRPHTLVIFESPYRVGKLLQDALAVLGDRYAAVCLELTKKFERVERGYLSDLAEAFGDERPRGEITVVIAGKHPKFTRAGTAEAEPA